MKIVIIGSSRGIGKFLSDNLKEHQIINVSRTINVDDCYQADATIWQEMDSCANFVKNKWGYIDSLIYCAGTLGKLGPAMDMEPDSWKNTININLNGFFNSVHSFYTLLNKAEYPKIITFSGGGATKGRPKFSAYASSKCGLVRLVETLALELPRFNINAIAPGAILTNMTNEIITAGPETVGEEEYSNTKNVNRSPDKTLELVKFLLSQDSKGISGRLIAAIWDDWKNPGCYNGEAGLIRRIEPK